VATGLVSNLAHPDRNITGFTLYEHSLSGKWLGLLKEIAPQITDVRILFNPDTSPYAPFYIRSAQEMGERLAVRVTTAAVRQTADIAPAVQRIAASGIGGVLVYRTVASWHNIYAITALAAECRYRDLFGQIYVVRGGRCPTALISRTSFRDGASVDRILRGIRLNDLPVQFATKFDGHQSQGSRCARFDRANRLLVDAELIVQTASLPPWHFRPDRLF
jgi:putative ABC transport system substrate-binding protein